MAAGGGWVRVDGAWRSFDPSDNPDAGLWVRVGGVWKPATEAFVREGGSWKQWYPKDGGVEPPPDCNLPGIYELNNIGSSIGSSTTAWADFDMTGYQGCGITNVRAIISWLTGTSYTFTIWADPAGIGYNRNKLPEYQGRTIYHNLSASQISAFESGAATRIRLTKPQGVGWSTEISNIRLEVTLG